jgi:hypothetical protein
MGVTKSRDSVVKGFSTHGPQATCGPPDTLKEKLLHILQGLSISEDAFPNLRPHALKMCALLGSTYSCEQFVSRMKHVQSKTRTQITDQHLEDNLRIATSDIDANIDNLVKEKHRQVSY